MTGECRDGTEDGFSVFRVAQVHVGVLPEAIPDPEDHAFPTYPPLPFELKEREFEALGRESGLECEQFWVVAEDRRGAGLGAEATGEEREPRVRGESLEIGVVEEGAVHAAVRAAAHRTWCSAAMARSSSSVNPATVTVPAASV